MYKYNPKSLCADEFINHEEILETLRYADENKDNGQLIDQILEKARPRFTEKGTFCSGLTHREASVLLACQIPEKVEKMYDLAEKESLDMVISGLTYVDESGKELNKIIPGVYKRLENEEWTFRISAVKCSLPRLPEGV